MQIFFYLFITFTFQHMDRENKMLKWITAAVIAGYCTDVFATHALQFAF